MRRTIFIFLSSAVLFTLFSGCVRTSSQVQQPPKTKVVKQVVVQKLSKDEIAKAIKEERLSELNPMPSKEFVVYGEGIAPTNTISPAQAIALAKRAAVADAYRQLGEKLYGVRVNSKETVKDAALKDSRIVTQVNGLIKNAVITDNKYKDGLYTVRMELTMSGAKWKEIFSY